MGISMKARKYFINLKKLSAGYVATNFELKCTVVFVLN